MKKTIITIAVILMLIVGYFPNVCLAANTTNNTNSTAQGAQPKKKKEKDTIWDKVIGIFNSISENVSDSENTWISPDDYKPGDMQNADKIKNVGNNIIGIFQFIGSFVSVIVLIVLGIKYMIGSIEEKAEYKKTMWPYLVGAILVFGITNILAIVSNIVAEI